MICGSPFDLSEGNDIGLATVYKSTRMELPVVVVPNDDCAKAMDLVVDGR